MCTQMVPQMLRTLHLQCSTVNTKLKVLKNQKYLSSLISVLCSPKKNVKEGNP